MKKNLYLRQCLRRENHLKNFIFDTAMSLASYPRLVLEAFIRPNQGYRYFRLTANLSVAFILAIVPLVAHKLPSLSDFSANYTSLDDYNDAHAFGWSFMMHYGSWYLLLVAFLVFTRKRWREVRRNPGVFDFALFTLYSGDINARFFDLHPLGGRVSIRAVECIYEPAVIFVLGIVLSFLGQRVGPLLMVSSVVYGLSYAAAYKRGDDFIMDKIDEIILNEEHENTFINDNYSVRGVRYQLDKPADINLRRKLTDSFIVDDRSGEEITFAE